MVTASFWATALPLASAAGAVVCVGVWAARIPNIALWFLCLTLVIGQAWRVPLPGQGGGLLLSDLAVVVVLWAVLWQRRVTRDLKTLLWLLLPFIAWSALGLVTSPLLLTPAEFLVAAAYWIRLTTHLLLLPALLLLTTSSQRQKLLGRLLTASVLLLVILGALQLAVVPRLEKVSGGWDPHVYRLVATWLDPNLLGGCFGILLPWLVARSLAVGKYRIFSILLAVLTAGALVATQSRSSLVALAAGVSIVSPLMAWRYITSYARLIRVSVVGAVLLLVIIVGAWVFGDRVWGLVTFDSTVTLRLQSLAAAWSLVLDHPFRGVGYNAYQFAGLRAGVLSDFTNHSRAGTDNSWLVVWATTGIIGVALFMLPWLWIIQKYLKQAIRNQQPEQLAALTGLIIWVVHSQFVNSGLYAHLLIAVAIILACTWPHRSYD